MTETINPSREDILFEGLPAIRGELLSVLGASDTHNATKNINNQFSCLIGKALKACTLTQQCKYWSGGSCQTALFEGLIGVQPGQAISEDQTDPAIENILKLTADCECKRGVPCSVSIERRFGYPIYGDTGAPK
jgi:hypothetical protein